MTQEEFAKLQARNQPHAVLRKDFYHYTPLSFANAFLPSSGVIVGKASRLYDGAGLFAGIEPSERELRPLSDTGKLITLISYTMPVGVEAEAVIEKVQPVDYELLTFFVIDEDDNIVIRFRFGSQFRDWLHHHIVENKLPTSVSALANKEYRTDRSAVDSYFNRRLTHRSFMDFVLKTMGIQFKPMLTRYKYIESVAWQNGKGETLTDIRYNEPVCLAMDGITQGGKVKVNIGKPNNGRFFLKAPEDRFTFLVPILNGQAKTPLFSIGFDEYDESKEEYDPEHYSTSVPTGSDYVLTAKIILGSNPFELQADEHRTLSTYHRNYEELVGLFYRPDDGKWENETECERGDRDAVQNYENYFIGLYANNGIKKLVDDFVAFLLVGNGLTTEAILRRVETDAAKLWQLAVAQAKNGNLDDRPLYWARNKIQVWLKRHPAYKNDFDPDTSMVRPDTELAAVIKLFEEMSRNYTGINFDKATGDDKAQEKIEDAKTSLANAYALPLDDPEREQRIADAEQEHEKAKKVFKVLITGFDPFQLNEFEDYGNILQSNPSGCVALSLHGKALGQGYIQTMIVPVRYTDFDSSADPERGQGPGIIENYLGKWVEKVDMIITVSQAGENDYNIDVFATATRGGAPDNMNFIRQSESRSLDVDYETIVTNLPSSFVNEPSHARYFGKFFEDYIEYRKFKGEIDLSPHDSMPFDGLYPQSKTYYGPGGNYLSNEIFYRAAYLRETFNKRNSTGEKKLLSGHFHIERLQNDDSADFVNSRMQKALDKIVQTITYGIQGIAVNE